MMRIGKAWMALVVLCLASGLVPAQELTSGTIAGRVTDPTGKPIAGAVIIATSQYGTRTADTDKNGNYILPFLRPGLHNVRVEAPGGFSTVIRNDVSVGLNQRTELNFTLQPGKTETVTVTGETPLVDSQSTSTTTNIRYDEFANSVPLGRSFTDTYAVAPGVVSGLGTGQGNYSISGASGLENAYLIDGVNITNTGYGGIGSYNINYGSLGTGVTSEFLEEVQIKTGGFEAEYGQALGGIINTIVKSGTNEVKGSVAYYAAPGLESGRQGLVLDSPIVSNVVEQSVNDFAFSLGGPIVKDKLFYFFAYNPVIRTTTLRALTANRNPESVAFMDPALVTVFDETIDANAFGSPTGAAIDPLAFPSSRRTLDRDRNSKNYAGKITWQASAKHNVELSFFGDPSDGDEGAQRDLAPLYVDVLQGGGQSQIRYGAHNQGLKWNAVFTPKFFMEAQFGRHDGFFREDSVSSSYYYRDRRNLLEFTRGADMLPSGGSIDITPTTIRRGGLDFISDQDDKSNQYSVKFTNVLGNHEIKYGAQYDDISYRDTATYVGPSFTLFLPEAGGGPPIPIQTRGGAQVDVRNGVGTDPAVAFDSANVFRVVRARVGPELPPTTSEEMSLFVQDTWQILPRLTIKGGVRWTQQHVSGSGEFDLPFQQAPGGFVAGTSTYEPGEYTFSGNIAPRFGVSWDVLGNGRSRLWANWGRYFQRVSNDLAIRAFNNEVGVSRAQYTDRDLTTPDGGPVFLQGVEPSNVVAGVKLPYEDELAGGYAFEVTPNSSFEIRAIYRTQGRALEDVQVNAVEQIQNYYYGTNYYYPYDPFPGFAPAPFGAYELGNPGTKQVPAGGTFGFPKATRRYKALELIYNKRFSDNWSVYANYRFSRLIGNYEGLFRNDNLQSDPNITSLYDFPNSPLMSGQFNSGPLPADVSHVLHIYPSYTFGNKLLVGANFTWASGVPRTSLLAHPIYQNAGEIPGINPVYAYWTGATLTRTRSLSDALSDPAATSGVFLFDYDPVTRGNLGRTPDLVSLDLGMSYPFEFGKSTLTFRADVFNVFHSQEATLYVDTVEITAGVTDPDFLKAQAYQDPRAWRVSARWDF